MILTNGARSVYAKGGDDLVCVTGPHTGKYYPVNVRAGDGNDVGIQTGPGDVVVDNAVGHFTSAGEVRTTWTEVGGFSIVQSAGSQRMTFAGTDSDESVYWWSYDDATVDVTLGRGDDRWSSPTPPTPSSRLLGGPGRDRVHLASKEAGIDLDLPAGTMGVAAPAPYVVTASDFEDADLFAPSVTVRGTDGPNDIGLTACTGVVRLGGGGHDRLVGQADADVLLGGKGRDRADGGAGRDRCTAERKQRCER